MWVRALLLVLIFGFCGALSAEQGGHYRYAVDSKAASPQQKNEIGYVFDITVQNEQQLDAILNRADRLRGQFSPAEHGRITLVLHGEELRLFQKSRYNEFMKIVDKARQLDQQQLIDIKACQTAMSEFEIEGSELPDFIEQVPLAPIEIERLEKEKGYTRL